MTLLIFSVTAFQGDCSLLHVVLSVTKKKKNHETNFPAGVLDKYGLKLGCGRVGYGGVSTRGGAENTPVALRTTSVKV
jgi:hypothetical protein